MTNHIVQITSIFKYWDNSTDGINQFKLVKTGVTKPHKTTNLYHYHPISAGSRRKEASQIYLNIDTEVITTYEMELLPQG